jgi:hypothetical protein
VPIGAQRTAVDEGLEALALAFVLAHRAGVDAKREPRIGVAKLGHHLGGGPPQCEEQ